MQLIDIGANLAHGAFDADRERVLAEACEAGVSPVVITGTSVADSRAALRFAEKSALRCYATAGVHPHDAKGCGPETAAHLRELAAHKEVAAIGECGLDYNRDFSPRDIQREWFEKQVLIACALKKPLFLHERDAFDDFCAILAKHKAGITRMVVHCFTGDEGQLRAYLELDCYIGITGWVCDERRGTHLAPLLKIIPGDRLLLETDAPFLIPRDLPKPLKPKNASRNEPKYLVHIARTVARILGKSLETLAAETFRNSREFFGI